MSIMLAAAVLGQQGASGGGVEVAATAATASSVLSLSHTADLPSGITAGDVLVMVIKLNGNVTGPITASGWTSRAASTDGVALLEVFSRTADGSEGSTVAFTTSNENHATVVYRLTGAHGDVQAAVANGVTDPPSLSPAWGSAETLWIAATGHRQGTTSATNPTNYTDQLRADGGLITNNNACIYSAHRSATTATENPATWSVSGSHVRPHAATIAVRPA